ncbi:glycosyltransferase family 4 protein [Deinococcus sp. NW-56]|uniref:glycosyltransferase family 4 protein n=1 Tax=Deinococcus sp. NW-56 TaxID=2080419 RepID=UPI000CF3A394|nr:glycosyltransferase family 4 protein [Deinococcus sp. NW-56]
MRSSAPSTASASPTSPRTHIAFMTDAPRVAGSEVWLLDLLPMLQARGLQTTMFLSREPRLDELVRRFGEAGVAVHRYGALEELPELTRDFDLRVLQMWYRHHYSELLPRLRGPRWVVSHDQMEFHYPQPLRFTHREAYPWTKAGPFRQADRILTVSEWAGDFVRRQMRLPDVRVLHNGVDAERYRPAHDEAEREALREAHGFGRFTVLVPGRFAPEKNQMTALLAARAAPHLDFVFTGDMDSPIGNLVQGVARRGRVTNARFLGRRWDMPDLYRAADALLQPTLAENQSLVTLEAMASALPVVTTPIPAQAELVQDGVSGLLVKPRPGLLATALGALAAHPHRARDFGAAARAHILSRHTLTHTADRLAELLREP